MKTLGRKFFFSFFLLLFPAFASNGHSVTLSWQPSPSVGVTYEVFKGTTPGGENATPLQSGIDLNCTDQKTCTAVDLDVDGGKHYYYTVEACWAGTQTCSAPSNEAPALIPILPPTGVIIIQSN